MCILKYIRLNTLLPLVSSCVCVDDIMSVAVFCDVFVSRVLEVLAGAAVIVVFIVDGKAIVVVGEIFVEGIYENDVVLIVIVIFVVVEDARKL